MSDTPLVPSTEELRDALAFAMHGKLADPDYSEACYTAARGLRWLRDNLVSLLEASGERDQLRADLECAAGECLIPIPVPGSDIARVCVANRLIRNERDALRTSLSDATRERDALRADVERLRVSEAQERDHASQCDEAYARAEANAAAERLLREKAEAELTTERARTDAALERGSVFLWEEKQNAKGETYYEGEALRTREAFDARLADLTARNTLAWRRLIFS